MGGGGQGQGAGLLGGWEQADTWDTGSLACWMQVPLSSQKDKACCLVMGTDLSLMNASGLSSDASCFPARRKAPCEYQLLIVPALVAGGGGQGAMRSLGGTGGAGPEGFGWCLFCSDEGTAFLGTGCQRSSGWVLSVSRARDWARRGEESRHACTG